MFAVYSCQNPIQTTHKPQKAPQAPLTDFHTVLVYVLVNSIKTRQKGSKRHTDGIQPQTTTHKNDYQR